MYSQFVLDAIADTQVGDRVILQNLIDSLSSKDVQARRATLRQISLFPTSTVIAHELVVPQLSALLLTEDDERFLRETAKAIFTVVRDRKTKRSFKVLLEGKVINTQEALDAMTVASHPMFYEPVLNLVAAKGLDKRVRRDAIVTALELWPADSCGSELTTYQRPWLESGAVPTNPVFDVLQGRTKQKQATSESTLEEIALGTDERYEDIKMPALLVLGCLKNRAAVNRLIKRFHFAKKTERKRLAAFFGQFLVEATVPALGDCARRERSIKVRHICVTSLSNFALQDVHAQLTRIYRDTDVVTRRFMVDLFLARPNAANLDIVNYFMRRERNEALLGYIQSRLQKLPTTSK